MLASRREHCRTKKRRTTYGRDVESYRLGGVQHLFRRNFIVVAEEFTDSTKCRLGYVCRLGDISQGKFPSVRRRRAIFRLLALSRHFCSAIFWLLVCLRIDYGILTCLDTHLGATEGSHEEILDERCLHHAVTKAFRFPGNASVIILSL